MVYLHQAHHIAIIYSNYEASNYLSTKILELKQ